MDGSEEIFEAYIRQYRLDQDLSRNHKKQALFLILTIRDLKRLRFANLDEANHAHAKACRWLAEKQVFHSSNHEGYNELLAMIADSLNGLRVQIEEKFSS